MLRQMVFGQNMCLFLVTQSHHLHTVDLLSHLSTYNNFQLNKTMIIREDEQIS